MHRNRLGSTDIEVSALGLGTVKFGRNQQLRYPHAFSIPDLPSARRLLDIAAGLGINLLDTAPAYGNCEARLGELLQDRREQWVIATKVGETFDGTSSRFDYSSGAVETSVEQSLKNLRTDVIDLVLIHSNGDDVEILEQSDALETLMRLKARGWIRALGISHKTAAGAERAIALGCDVIMATLNLAEQQQAPLISRAAEAGCGVLVKKALASGHAGSASLAYAASCEGVSSVVVGTINPEHLRANAEVVQLS